MKIPEVSLEMRSVERKNDAGEIVVVSDRRLVSLIVSSFYLLGLLPFTQMKRQQRVLIVIHRLNADTLPGRVRAPLQTVSGAGAHPRKVN